MGIVCLACEAIKCDRRLDLVTEVPAAPRQLGSGIQFDDGLTDSEKAAITRVIDNSDSATSCLTCMESCLLQGFT